MSRIGVALLAATLLGGLLPATAPPAVRAATPDLALTAETRYDVEPDQARVRVTVALTAVNRLKDTKTRQFYFERAFLAVQPGATNLRISARTGAPTVRATVRKADHTLLRIDFGGRLGAGASRTFNLTFDIPDPGGAPTRNIRVGSSLVAFPAWAYGSEATPGGSVVVVFPAGYHVEVQGGSFGQPVTDGAGRIVFATGRLAEPLKFFAYFTADRPNDYAETTRTVAVDDRPLTLAIRSWPDDPAWGERVGGLVERGLPVLAARIGLPWTAKRPLIVAEAISRSAAGYSGLYDPAAGRIEIAWYADSFVVLHEVAHAWFDGGLLADRWANEGFASWYALQAAAELGEPVDGDPLTPELAAARIPLNAWGPIGGTEAATDDYGYAAAAELARLVAERAGPEALTDVWEAARQGVGAYQPPRLDGASRPAAGPAAGVVEVTGPVEAATGAPDWRGLLDLLEDRTGQEYDDLWRTWVVREGETALLDERAAARRRYEAVVRRAGDWHLPRLVRDALRAWQFDQATELLDAADRTLDDRDAVLAAAAAAGLEAPDALRVAFEGQQGFAAAAAEADAQQATIEAYVLATRARPVAPDAMQQIGMWGASPEAHLESAASAFARGDLRASVQGSALARAIWEGAAELGRTRAISALTLLVAALLAMALVASSFRGWRAARRAARRGRMAHQAGRRDSRP